MKVLDLCCAHGHRFEGWFGSDDDFTSQRGRGLVECPLCADRSVTRLPSAPRLNLSASRDKPRSAAVVEPGSAASAPPVPAGPPADAPPRPADLQTLWVQAVRHLMAHTEDVGTRFAEEARRIHYGEAAERGIRGQTTDDERAALADEGIEVMAIAVPQALKGSTQ